MEKLEILEQGLYLDFQTFEDIVAEHTARVFSEILSDPEETPYCLSLFYSGDTFAYLFPTYNTEEELLLDCIKENKKNSTPAEQHAKSIRWSPCEFGHHGSYDDISSEASRLLSALYIDPESIMASYQSAEGEFDWESYDDEISDKERRVHKAIHQRVLNALRTVSQHDFIQQRWQNNEFLMVNLLCGDQSIEQRIEHARLIGNPEWVIERYQKEVAGDFQLKLEAQNPFADIENISLDELLPFAEQYQPEVMINQGALEVSPYYRLNYSGEDSVKADTMNNKFQILSLLNELPEYDEIKYYYHTIGNNEVKKGNALFEFGCVIAEKLSAALRDALPEESCTVILSGFYPFMICMYRGADKEPDYLRDEIEALKSGDCSNVIVFTT